MGLLLLSLYTTQTKRQFIARFLIAPYFFGGFVYILNIFNQPSSWYNGDNNEIVIGIIHFFLNTQFCKFGACGILFYCHYSQVESDLELKYVLGSHVLVKWIGLKIISIWLECAPKHKKQHKNTNTKEQWMWFPNL